MLIPSTGFWMGWLKGMSHRLITPGTLFRRLYSWQNEGRSEQKYALVCQKPSSRFASTTQQNCKNALILQKCVLMRYGASSSPRADEKSIYVRVTPPAKWKVKSPSLVFVHQWAKVRQDVVELPNGVILDDYFYYLVIVTDI